jgi:plasmid maintenance system antidote protein VapI
MRPPFLLVDTMIEELKLRTDARVAKLLKVPPSTISKWRHGTAKVSGDKILRVYDVTGWSIEKIRELLK